MRPRGATRGERLGCSNEGPERDGEFPDETASRTRLPSAMPAHESPTPERRHLPGFRPRQRGWILKIVLSCNIISYMKRDSKLSSVLHLLLHMAHNEDPLTSEELARYLDTNPVVVRRMLASLRDSGYVDSVKGHGGGWSITCDLHRVTLLDIYRAVGSPAVFAMANREDQTECLVEKVVNHALDDAFREAEARLMARFGEVSLADLARDFSRHMKNRKVAATRSYQCANK